MGVWSFGKDRESLEKSEYILDSTLKKGLEGKENIKLVAKDIREKNVLEILLYQ